MKWETIAYKCSVLAKEKAKSKALTKRATAKKHQHYWRKKKQYWIFPWLSLTVLLQKNVHHLTTLNRKVEVKTKQLQFSSYLCHRWFGFGCCGWLLFGRWVINVIQTAAAVSVTAVRGGLAQRSSRQTDGRQQGRDASVLIGPRLMARWRRQATVKVTVRITSRLAWGLFASNDPVLYLDLEKEGSLKKWNEVNL
jgi:hypothetical protein